MPVARRLTIDDPGREREGGRKRHAVPGRRPEGTIGRAAGTAITDPEEYGSGGVPAPRSKHDRTAARRPPRARAILPPGRPPIVPCHGSIRTVWRDVRAVRALSQPQRASVTSAAPGAVARHPPISEADRGRRSASL